MRLRGTPPDGERALSYVGAPEGKIVGHRDRESPMRLPVTLQNTKI